MQQQTRDQENEAIYQQVKTQDIMSAVGLVLVIGLIPGPLQNVFEIWIYIIITQIVIML
jgi:hypothetical protein